MGNVKSVYNKIYELLKTYEDYLFFHKDANLNVIIEQNTISFYLLGDEKEDNFIIDFDETDINAFNYISTKIIIKLFGNVLMHFDGQTIFNKKHKENINIIILNDNIKDIVNKLISVQETEYLNDDNLLVKELNFKARSRYPQKFMKVLSDRVDLSKKYLQSR